MTSRIQRVSVCGLGKLGACMAATTAARGFQVVGIDIDEKKVRDLNEGRPPVEETLLAETVASAKSRLSASLDARAVVETDATFFIPPTPSHPDGSFNSDYLLRAMQSVASEIARAGKKGHLFVCNSTTTPGTMDKIILPMLEKELRGVAGRDFGVIYNPEFIALGDVVRGLLNPDFVLLGESDSRSGELMEHFYIQYCQNQPPIRRMTMVSAELCKISVNSFVTMKISFTNQLRLVAQGIGADATTILKALGEDSRIGAKYLRPGLSYGGPCFPRDNRLFSWVAKAAGVRAFLAEATDQTNEAAKEDLFCRVKSATTPPGSVAILGMAYKPNTYITEESPGLHLAQRLKHHGYHVLVHDISANPANSPALHGFEMMSDPRQSHSWQGVASAVICCPWPQYEGLMIPSAVRQIDAWTFPAVE